jgi:hypothetical protein
MSVIFRMALHQVPAKLGPEISLPSEALRVASGVYGDHASTQNRSANRRIAIKHTGFALSDRETENLRLPILGPHHENISSRQSD